jgi:hypothetical protein
LALALAPACDGGKDDTNPEGDTDTDTDTDVDEGPVGRIAVVEHYDQLHDEHTGAVAIWGPLDGPWEAGVVGDWSFDCGKHEGDTGIFRVTTTAGECELAVLATCSGACDPACDAGYYCAGGATCTPEPAVGDAGTLTIGGLSQAVTIPFSHGAYYPPWDMPEDLFSPGDTLTLEAAGGDLPSFATSATGVVPLQATLPCDALPSPDQDFTVTWIPSAEAGGRMRWEMLQEVHLAMGPRIRCETDDVGSLTIPASMMQAYLQSERQTYVLSRFDQARVAIEVGHTVDFEARSSVGCIINEEHTPW